MGQCQYCKRPTEGRATYHADCHGRHQRAISMIPDFFAKLLTSRISPERFTDLLLNAADVSFVSAEELQSLCIDGMAQLVNSVLDHRLLTVEEENFIAEVRTALNPLLAECPGLDDVITQVEILRDLGNGKVPNRVTVEGPMPIAQRGGETVLWIFNEITAFRLSPVPTELSPQIRVPIATDTYLGLSHFHRQIEFAANEQDDNIGDLVLTNYSCHFLSRTGRQTRSPIARIAGLWPCANGVIVEFKQITLAYILNDHWFLANAIARLTQFSHRKETPPTPPASLTESEAG